MAINNYETGHKFGPYELNYDENLQLNTLRRLRIEI